MMTAMRILGLSGFLIALCSLSAMNVQLEDPVTLAQEKQKELHCQLIKASKAGDAALIRELLDKGASLLEKERVMYVYDEGEAVDLFFTYTAFDWAAVYGHTECLEIFLDRLEDSTPAAFRQKNYQHLKSLKKNRKAIVPLFQRGQKSLSELSKCIANIRHYTNTVVRHGSFVDPEWYVLERIEGRLEKQLSLNVVLSRCSSNEDSLRRALLSAGAEYATDSPPSDSRIQEHLDRLLPFAILEGNVELLTALIQKNANVNAEVSAEREKYTPLHFAAMRDRDDMAKLLIGAGASVEYASTVEAWTPLQITCLFKSFRTAQLLLETGAPMWKTEDRMAPAYRQAIDYRSYYKVLMQASIRRYAPTKEEAKKALQNIAHLIYVFGIRLNLPPYVIYEILFFATTKETPLLRTTEQEWALLLMKDLAVVYLYKCNGGNLLPLWREVIGAKAHKKYHKLLIPKLNHYMTPFLGDEVKKYAGINLLTQIYNEGTQLYVIKLPEEEENSLLSHVGQYLRIEKLAEAV